MGPKALTVDNRTRASNPGGLRVQYLVFLRSYPLFGLWCFGSLAASLALAPWNLTFLILAVLLGAVAALWLIRVREYFQHGCVNAAKVVSHRPDLIAVITDLTTGKGNTPVVKIVPHPLGRMSGGRPPVGTRLATVALYSGNGQKGHWDNFFPVAVNCATADRGAIQSLLRGIPARDWVELDEGLSQVSNPKAPGLYNVDLAALKREEWAIRNGLNRLDPTDVCTVLCPTDDP